MNSLVVWMDKVGREGPRRAVALFNNRVERTAAMRFGFKSRPLLFLVLFGIVAFPQHAWANGGTPLMWTTSLHLFFGNALIGLGEGILLARLFSLPERKCIAPWLSHYASAWLGVLFIQGTVVDALPMDLTNEWMWFWGMVAATYRTTLLLEWPSSFGVSRHSELVSTERAGLTRGPKRVLYPFVRLVLASQRHFPLQQDERCRLSRPVAARIRARLFHLPGGRRRLQTAVDGWKRAKDF